MLWSLGLQAQVVVAIIGQVLPAARVELERWERAAGGCRHAELRAQALSSLKWKRFHAQGASVYALRAGRHRADLVAAAVALQTISDYLDNLCDRVGVQDEAAFRRLHLAMTAAVGALPPARGGFFDAYPLGGDGGYLEALVAECHRHVNRLPSIAVVRARVIRLLELYADLQVLKHLHPSRRVMRLRAWHAHRGRRYAGLEWNEFAAACGSTLGVFALLSAAANPGLLPERAARIEAAYFPAVCALHILLDYLIDQDEDAATGDLNFVTCYPGPTYARRRLLRVLSYAQHAAGSMPDPAFHRTVVQGLLGVYLSDPKVEPPGYVAGGLLQAGGAGARVLHRLCLRLRRCGLLQER